MSWQPYVDDQMVGTKNLKRGAIVGHDGSVWAITSGWGLQAKDVLAVFKAQGDQSLFQKGAQLPTIDDNGKDVGNGHFKVLRADERSIYLRLGTNGYIFVKTGSSYLVGFYDKSMQSGSATSTMEKLADYLIEQGY